MKVLMLIQCLFLDLLLLSGVYAGCFQSKPEDRRRDSPQHQIQHRHQQQGQVTLHRDYNRHF
uniref:Uncharacterized protein n=1 Tax=Meloidogyne enterolobii TaxID=390850 RepID=A0A6V7V2K4_MELEN|nr:unnamed protein product [Meloidogyne enterolobii]